MATEKKEMTTIEKRQDASEEKMTTIEKREDTFERKDKKNHHSHLSC